MPPKIPALLTPAEPLLEDDTRWQAVSAEQLRFPGVQARSLAIVQSRLTGVDLQGAQLERPSWSDTELLRCNLANLELGKGSLLQVLCRDCKWSGSRLREMLLRDVHVIGTKLDFASFSACKLKNVVFEDCDLQETEWSAVEFEGVRFLGCRLERASFARPAIKSLEFRRGSLRGVRGWSALRGASFPRELLLEFAEELALELGFRIVD